MYNKILIVGAGPTGLVLALTLDHLNVPFKIIDQKDQPDEVSKAMLVVPGTLDHYSQLGLVGGLFKEGLELTTGFIHTPRDTQKVNFQSFQSEISRFTKLFTYPQDEHERLLIRTLKARGHQIHWNTSFQKSNQEKTEVHVEMMANSELTKEDFQYVVGADGGSSTVRKALDIAFEGETNEQIFFVSDVELKNEELQGEIVHAFMTKDDFLLAFPLRDSSTKRLIGVIPKELEVEAKIDMEEITPILKENLGLEISETSWFSEYKIHHRLAESFQKGRIFLAGDAAHIHSPVGGQGMNAGIADAVNLGWKLAGVLNKKVHPNILTTYEEERREYAKQLVKTTDRAFKTVTADNFIIGKIRETFVTILADIVLNKSDTLSERLFKTISQTGIQYKNTALNTDDSNNKLLGSRLPYYNNNFDLIDEMTWHVQIYGEPTLELEHFLKEYGLPYQTFKWEDTMRNAGFVKDAAYFVRPDGYIAWTSRTQDYQSLVNYLRKWKILPN